MKKEIKNSIDSNIEFILKNATNLNENENKVLIYSILEELCKQIPINRKYCPICKHESDFFLPYGDTPRKNALCPHCFSLERHRLLYLFFKKQTNIFSNKTKFLNINPENLMTKIFNDINTVNYNTITIENKNKVNLIKKFEKNTYDIVFTSNMNIFFNDLNSLKYLYKIINKNGSLIFIGNNEANFELKLNILKRIGFKIRKFSISDMKNKELIDKYSLIDMPIIIAEKK